METAWGKHNEADLFNAGASESPPSGGDKNSPRQYKLGVRHINPRAAAVTTPTPQSFTCILLIALLAGSGLSFYIELALLGFNLGRMIVIGCTILLTSLWCLG